MYNRQSLPKQTVSNNMEDDLIAKSEAACDLLRTEEELSRFLKLNNTSVRLFYKLLRKLSSTEVGPKRKYECQVTKLKSLNLRAKNRVQKRGAGIQRQKRSDYVTWIDLKSAFRSRIRTGAVVNLRHKFVDPFLADAMVLIKRRLQNELKKNINLKVNMELSCRYELTRTGEVSDKFFATSNISLTPTSNLDEALGQIIKILQTKV